MSSMERPISISSPLSSIIDDYTAKPLPPLPLAYSRTSSVYSQGSSLEQQNKQQDEPNRDIPEQIYLQPTRFYSSTSKLPVQKFALYEQPQHSTLSLRLRPKLEESNAVLHRAASYSKTKRHGESGRFLGLRDRPRERLSPLGAGAQLDHSASQVCTACTYIPSRSKQADCIIPCCI